MAANSRTPRDAETREVEKREEPWRPPSLLPTPVSRPGVTFRWIRTSAYGETDNKNVSARFREGWVPVKAADHPELMLRSDRNSDFPDGIEVGGLLLCQNATESVKQRSDYYAQRAQQQIESVDNAYLRENDSRMPMSRPERRTHVVKGQVPKSED
jgi:hypothetical protein